MSLLLLLLALSAPLRAAECPAHLAGILAELDARGLQDTRFDCDSLRAAAELLGVEAGTGTWFYRGERELRERLEKFEGARVPEWLLPIGSLERESPGGGRALYVLAYDFGAWGRLWPLIALMRDPRAPEQDLLEVIGDGSDYDTVGYFPRGPDGRSAQAGRWVEVPPGATSWDVNLPLVRSARACLPCAGWLCVEAPEACFADMDGDGREEIWLAGWGRRSEELRVYAPDDGGLSVVFSEPETSGTWERRGKAWVLAGRTRCEEGEGFCPGTRAAAPICRRPEVYKFSAPRRLEPDAALREEFYPVAVRPAPAGCKVSDSDGVLVRAGGGKFIRYLPPAGLSRKP